MATPAGSTLSVRLEVTPRDAEVYVDGYYAGTVDDFDGTFQRLRVEPGQHDLEIYKDGFRPLRQKAYLSADNTFRIKQALQPLAAGEQMEPRPQPVPRRRQDRRTDSSRRAHRCRAGDRAGRRLHRRPAATRATASRQTRRARRRRIVRLRSRFACSSADVEVTVDGEVWRGPAGQDRS
jgi:hypothetical protein